MNNKDKFSLDYFTKGPYKKAKIEGVSKYFGKYFWARRFYSKLIARLTPPGGSILEIGCGFGDLLLFLEKDFKTFGTDISKDAITKAEKNLSNTKLAVIKSEELYKLGNIKFDTIVACHVLEHLRNPEIALKQISKYLKKTGSLFVVVPNPDSIGRKMKNDKWIGFSDKTHISLYRPHKWFSLFKKHNFDVRTYYSDGLWDSPYIGTVPVFIQRLFFGLPAIIQTLTTIMFIPLNLGESAIVISKKK